MWRIRRLFIVSAPSGAGKTSLVQKLVRQDSNVVTSISHTTREQRRGEINGKDYFFISHDKFNQMVKAGNFIEHAKVFDNYYGTSLQSVRDMLQQGMKVILEIDWQGALQIKSSMPSCVMIFLIPPSKEVLLARLKNRGTDSDQEIAYRFNQAVLDLEQSKKFDHVLVNDQLDKVVTEIALCIEGKTNKINQSKKVAESLKSFFETN